VCSVLLPVTIPALSRYVRRRRKQTLRPKRKAISSFKPLFPLSRLRLRFYCLPILHDSIDRLRLNLSQPSEEVIDPTRSRHLLFLPLAQLLHRPHSPSFDLIEHPQLAQPVRDSLCAGSSTGEIQGVGTELFLAQSQSQ
jgi:hypothetical protein